jgi:hypothetical protein
LLKEIGFTIVDGSKGSQQDYDVQFWPPVFRIGTQSCEYLHSALTVSDVGERTAASLFHDVLEHRRKVMVGEVLE